MTDPARVRVDGPLEPYAQGFRRTLADRGYSPNTVACHLRLMGHLSRWLAGQGMDGSALEPVVVDAYLAHRRAGGYATYHTGRALQPLLGYLRERGVVAMAVPPQATPVQLLLARFAGYLAGERGLAERTIRNYVHQVQPFLQTWQPDGLRWLRAGDVTAFVLARCRDNRGGTAVRMVTALRSLLRFLHVDGLIDQPLVQAVPSVAAWKLAGLPKALDASQVSALLASCDKATVVGRRDYAILMVLVRLGLRAGELASLSLDDIDWRRGELTVRGKGNRHERLPLPVDVGHAVVSYLEAGRPATTATGRQVFTTVRAPYRALTRGSVTQVVASAARRAGLGRVYAHRLRHTAATGMLRGGGSLAEIGQVLRHHRALTTMTYAKVDIDALRALARPWLGGAA
jgi:site-specific recombinase XerD